jgi:hypothetical protein
MKTFNATHKGDNMKLNCWNFQVNTNEGYFYLCDGYRSLWRLSKKINVPFKNLCAGLVHEDQVVFLYNEDGTRASITRI